MTAPLISVRKLQKVYAGQDQPLVALKDIDLEVREGEFLYLVGPSIVVPVLAVDGPGREKMERRGEIEVELIFEVRVATDRAMEYVAVSGAARRVRSELAGAAKLHSPAKPAVQLSATRK